VTKQQSTSKNSAQMVEYGQSSGAHLEVMMGAGRLLIRDSSGGFQEWSRELTSTPAGLSMRSSSCGSQTNPNSDHDPIDLGEVGVPLKDLLDAIHAQGRHPFGDGHFLDLFDAGIVFDGFLDPR